MTAAVAPESEAVRVPVSRRVLVRMLLISLGLHAALLIIVQPREFPPTVVEVPIEARLEPLSAEPELVLAETPPLPPPVQDSPEPLPDRAPPAPPAEFKLPEESKAVAVVSPVDKPVSRPETTVRQETPAAAVAVVEKPALPTVPVLVDNQWYELKKADTPPRRQGSLDLSYPAGPRQRGVEGRVKLKLWIDEFGDLKDVEVIESHPAGVFDEFALAAIRKTRYQPAIKDGRPIRVVAYTEVSYTLEDE